MSKRLDLAVIIVNFNTEELTLRCLESVFKQKVDCNFKVLVVDNGSGDQSVNKIKEKFKQVEVIETGKNLGFAAGNNVGLEKVDADYYLLLNSDTEVRDDCFNSLVKVSRSHDWGILSAKLLNQDLSFQCTGGYLPSFWRVFAWLSGLDDILRAVGIKFRAYHLNFEREYSSNMELGWVGGTAMLISDKVKKRIGLLDEEFFMYVEDVDYCFRAKKAGFGVSWSNESQVIHLGGGSSKSPRVNQWRGEFLGLVKLYRKHYGGFAAKLLDIEIKAFIVFRMMVFSILGRREVAGAYAQVSKSL